MKYITLAELSRLLGGRSRSSIYRDIEAGRLPKPMKFGARLYWNEAEVRDVIDAHRAIIP